MKRFVPENIRSVLVTTNNECLGDALIKMPFIWALKRCFPHAQITWMTRNDTVFATILAPIAETLNLRVIPHTKLGTRLTDYLWPCVKTERFALIIDTSRKLNRALAAWRLPHEWFYSSTQNHLLCSFPCPTQERNRACLGELMQILEHIMGHPVPVLWEGINIPAELKQEALRLLPEGKQYVGIAPGSAGAHKCWPLTRYLALAQKIYDTGVVPVFFLGPQEEKWVSEVQAICPWAMFPLQNASVPVTPFLTMALSERLSAGISNDGGGAHLMACAQIPLVCLYGPTEPDTFAPNTPHLQVLEARTFDSRSMGSLSLDVVWSVVGPLIKAPL